MELAAAAQALAQPGAEFIVMGDNAHRSLVVARSGDGAVHFVAAECVDDPTATWVAAALRHGAAGAAGEIAGAGRIPPPPDSPA